MLPGHLFGGTGAGDVKLMAAIGAIVGPATVVTAFFFTALAGGVLALAVAARRRRLGATLAGTGKLIGAPIAGTGHAVEPIAARRFAYGPAIAIGSVLAGMLG
jgi:prepilin peptidase CpaA